MLSTMTALKEGKNKGKDNYFKITEVRVFLEAYTAGNLALANFVVYFYYVLHSRLKVPQLILNTSGRQVDNENEMVNAVLTI